MSQAASKFFLIGELVFFRAKAPRGLGTPEHVPSSPVTKKEYKRSWPGHLAGSVYPVLGLQQGKRDAQEFGNCT